MKSTRSHIKKSLRVLALFDAIRPTELNQNLDAELKTEDWKTEAHVLETLATLGCVFEHQAIFDDTDLIRQKVEAFKPDVIFNQADQFRNNRAFDQNIAAFLEMLAVPFTGCGSTGLLLCKHKGISKKILSYHRIRVPEFTTIPWGRRPVRPKRLKFPILIKPLKEEASMGISQASLVDNDEDFKERVTYIHEKLGNDVIAEEFIAGREFYVSLLGNRRLEVYPIRELVFREVPPDDPKIATYAVKWDDAYRKRWGIENEFAQGLDAKLKHQIEHVCKKIYHLLAIDGYARIDLRVTDDEQIVFIEANPNPFLARGEDFAESARQAGIEYPELIAKILNLGLRTQRE